MTAVQIEVLEDADQLARSVAGRIIEIVRESIDSWGQCTIALAGGSTPKRLYELLATQEYREQIDWAKVHFFLSDERYVPLDHPDSNFLMAKEALLDHVPVRTDQVYPMLTHLDPAEAAISYERQIRKVVPEEDGTPAFDLILLGIGDDGHTASLFPGTAALSVHDHLVIENHVPQQDAMRLSFTIPLLQAARETIVLATGSGKADAVSKAIEGDVNLNETPSQVLRQSSGRVTFAIDQEAASRLSS
jgi:6-phosphogluconolactonase